MFLRRAMLGNLSLTERVRRALFSNGEQGGMWDATDMGSLFREEHGTMPVTAVGQQIGLALDGRTGYEATGYGPADTFSSYTAAGTTPPIATAPATTHMGVSCASVTFPAIASGGYGVSRAASNNILNFAVSDYIYFECQYALSRDLAAGESIYIYATGTAGTSAGFITSGSAGTWYSSRSGYIAPASGINTQVTFANKLDAPLAVYIRQVVHKKIVGKHLIQPAAGKRAVLAQDGSGNYYAAFDGVDDFLRAIFGSLGSSCTIATIAPGGGASITGGQTISGNYDISADFHRHLVVDRALTGAETALVSAWLNEGAGL